MKDIPHAVWGAVLPPEMLDMPDARWQFYVMMQCCFLVHKN